MNYSEHDYLRQEFMLETADRLRGIQNDINELTLSIPVIPLNLLHRIFRNVHTIKGLAGFFDEPRLESISGSFEALLAEIRDEARLVDTSVSQALKNALQLMADEITLLQNQGKPLESRTLEAEKTNARSTHPPFSWGENHRSSLKASQEFYIKTLFDAMIPYVKKLEKALGKEIHLHSEAPNLSVNPEQVQGLEGVLIHLIRNACDHGIESPSLRKQSNKASYGTVSLEAFEKNDCLFIKVQDDGQGMDPSDLRQRALETGTLHTETDDLKSSDPYALIFEAGFSTSKHVSDISGRGVGMDAVYHALNSLGGDIQIQSQKGIGTSVLLQIPLLVQKPQSVSIKKSAPL
jgi:chemotaxis protein histidine kinase CheA